MLAESVDFRPSLCAGVCHNLPLFVASKGQEKGNVQKEVSLKNGVDRELTKDTRRPRDFGQHEFSRLQAARTAGATSRQTISRLIEALNLLQSRGRRVAPVRRGESSG